MLTEIHLILRSGFRIRLINSIELISDARLELLGEAQRKSHGADVQERVVILPATVWCFEPTRLASGSC
jgi:hypothetical protein